MFGLLMVNAYSATESGQGAHAQRESAFDPLLPFGSFRD
jgi:hypothetical protein